MRTVGGKYQIEDTHAVEFFGTHTINLIVRDSGVTGRFGREGFIHGTMAGQELSAQWRDGERSGWMRLHFGASFRNGEFEYGVEASERVLGRSLFVKRIRSPRARQ